MSAYAGKRNCITVARKTGLLKEDELKILNDKKLEHKQKFKILNKMAEVQINQSGNTNENIQLVALICCFYQ